MMLQTTQRRVYQVIEVGSDRSRHTKGFPPLTRLRTDGHISKEAARGVTGAWDRGTVVTCEPSLLVPLATQLRQIRS